MPGVRAGPGRFAPEHRLDDVLAKPIRAADLLTTVARLIATPRTGAPAF
jgi:hypothetical protein